MSHQTLAGLLALTVLTSPLVVQAAGTTPYWDNSSDSQGFYSTQQAPATQPAPAYGTPSGYGYGTPSGYGTQSQQSYNNYNNTQQPRQLQGYVSAAPAGTTMSVTNTSYLSSSSCQIGDRITTTLAYDLSMGGSLILPSGSQLQGQVVSCIPAGRAGRQGQIQLRFNQANLPDGRVYPLSARVVTPDGTGILRGGAGTSRLGGVAKNTLGGAALGAASGAALGALVSGGRKWNEGLMWGSILGAGGGLARSGVQIGDDAELQPGTNLQIMLDQPLSANGANMPQQPQQYGAPNGYGY